MSNRLIVVKAARDAETGVWFVESSDLPGLHIEADTLEAMIERLPGAALDLVEEGAVDDAGNGFRQDEDFSIEIIAHASTRVRARAAA